MINVEARRATEEDAVVISNLLASGPRRIPVTPESIRGTIALGSHCFILSLDDNILGFVELRAVHPEPERSDAAVVVWMVKRRPLGIGAAALGFILRHAFCALGLREVWGWVRKDNEPMLRLCRHLGIMDNGPWAGDPEFRLMTFSSRSVAEIMPVLERVHRKLWIYEQQVFLKANSYPVTDNGICVESSHVKQMELRLKPRLRVKGGYRE